MDFLVELLIEILLQCAAEVLGEVGLGAVAHSLRGRRTANPVLAGAGLVLLGALAGFGSSWLFPRRIGPEFGFSGVSLVLAPLGTGAFMGLYGSWRSARGGNPTFLATFWGGGLFAFAMSAARWMLVGRL